MAALTREAKRRLEGPLVTFLLSLAMAVVVGVIVYVVTSALPYLGASPTTDPNFGNQNHCLLTALPTGRTGFAVFDTEAVAYSGSRLARCGPSGPAQVFEVESLAGRVGLVDLSGFHTGEVKADEIDDLWLRGGFPRSFLSKCDAASWRWRSEFRAHFFGA